MNKKRSSLKYHDFIFLCQICFLLLIVFSLREKKMKHKTFLWISKSRRPSFYFCLCFCAYNLLPQDIVDSGLSVFSAQVLHNINISGSGGKRSQAQNTTLKWSNNIFLANDSVNDRKDSQTGYIFLFINRRKKTRKRLISTHNVIQLKLVEIQVFMLVRMELIVRYLGLVNVLDCFNLA